MRTVVLGEPPVELARLLDRRRALGQDRFDEEDTFVATAAVVVEVVSPDDETYRKFDFYASHGVDELIVADPGTRTVRCWRLRAASYYVEVDASAVLGVATSQVTDDISWP